MPTVGYDKGRTVVGYMVGLKDWAEPSACSHSLILWQAVSEWRTRRSQKPSTYEKDTRDSKPTEGQRGADLYACISIAAAPP